MLLRDELKGMLRKHIKSKQLSTPLNSLWQKAERIHNLQNKQDGTENGRLHVETVEYNIYELLTKSPGIGIKKFNSYERFLLSASACCHDFDKAKKKLDSKIFPQGKLLHGEGSSAFIIASYEKLGFDDKRQAEDVGKIIAAHDLKGQDFKDNLAGISFKKIRGAETFNHKTLALLLKAADILHTDDTRIIKETNIDELDDLSKSKYNARSAITGWHINGSDIVIDAEIENDVQEKAINACKDYMKNTEWPCIGEYLELIGFPCNLKFDIVDNRTPDEKSKDRNSKGSSEMQNQDQTEKKQNRPHTAQTHLKRKETDAMLCYAIEPNAEQYPICPDEQVTHMAGVAVARIAVTEILDKALYLKNASEEIRGDLYKEKVFSPNKLNEHIRYLTELKNYFFLITNPSKSTERLFLAFQRIPNGEKVQGGREIISNIKRVQTSLSRLLAKLNNENIKITSEIEKMPPEQQVKLPDNKKKYKTKIEPLLREQTPNEMAKMTRELENIISNIETLKEALRDDWIADIVVLWKNKTECEPFQKRRCTV